MVFVHAIDTSFNTSYLAYITHSHDWLLFSVKSLYLNSNKGLFRPVDLLYVAGGENDLYLKSAIELLRVDNGCC